MVFIIHSNYLFLYSGNKLATMQPTFLFTISYKMSKYKKSITSYKAMLPCKIIFAKLTFHLNFIYKNNFMFNIFNKFTCGLVNTDSILTFYFLRIDSDSTTLALLFFISFVNINIKKKGVTRFI